MATLTLPSPFGPFTLTETGGEIASLSWGTRAQGAATPLLDEAARQLGEYFAGSRQDFDLPLTPATGLEADFRAALRAIPFGDTLTYGDLAKTLGQPAQAIGQLCGANPLPVIVPCHRVLGANGLGGYSGGGGIETKVALLKHEGAASLLI